MTTQPTTTDMVAKLLKIAPRERLESWAKQHTTSKYPHRVSKENLVALLVDSDCRPLRSAIVAWVGQELIGEPQEQAMQPDGALPPKTPPENEIMVDRGNFRVVGGTAAQRR